MIDDFIMETVIQSLIQATSSLNQNQSTPVSANFPMIYLSYPIDYC